MKLPHDAQVLETSVFPIGAGWFAGIRFTTSRHGGYDRSPHDDMFRTLPTEADAHAWIAEKLANREVPRDEG